MRLADIGFWSLEGLKRKGGKAALAVLGVLIGCFSLIMLVSLQLNEKQILNSFQQLALGVVGVICLGGAAAGIRGMLSAAAEERKWEISLMKALGCFKRDIYVLFMMEAGLIGLLGGLGGCLASRFASTAMDLATMEDFKEGRVFRLLFYGEGSAWGIPFWLMLIALLFSILTGLFSGSYPAEKAVKTPILEGIHK